MMLVLIWFGLLAILVGLELTLLVYWLWPRFRRIIYCPWCWQACGIRNWYPSRWSSTICRRHEQAMRTQSARRRAQRQAKRPAQRQAKRPARTTSIPVAPSLPEAHEVLA